MRPPGCRAWGSPFRRTVSASLPRRQPQVIQAKLLKADLHGALVTGNAPRGARPWGAQALGQHRTVLVVAMSLATQTSPHRSEVEITAATLASSGHSPHAPDRPCAFSPPGPPPVSRRARRRPARAHGPES